MLPSAGSVPWARRRASDLSPTIQSCGMNQKFAMPQIDVGSNVKTADTSLEAIDTDAFATPIDSRGTETATPSEGVTFMLRLDSLFEHHNIEQLDSRGAFHGVCLLRTTKSDALGDRSKLIHGNVATRRAQATPAEPQIIAETLDLNAVIISRSTLKLALPHHAFVDEMQVRRSCLACCPLFSPALPAVFTARMIRSAHHYSLSPWHMALRNRFRRYHNPWSWPWWSRPQRSPTPSSQTAHG